MNYPDHDDDKSYKTLKAIHDEAVDAIITINESGIIESINPATEQLFGFQASELLNQNIKILMPNPHHDAHDGYIDSYLNEGVKKIIGIGREVLGKRRDGTTFPIHLAVNEIKVGETRMFAGVIRDLTEFKRLEDQGTALGRIIEDSLNEIYIFDSVTLKFVQVNRGARENLGRSIDELRAMTPIDIKQEFDEAGFRARIKPLVDGDVLRMDFESSHIRKDRSSYEVEVHLQKSTFQDRPAIVAIVLDITQRRSMEREVQRKREAIQAELEQLVKTQTNQLRETQAELVQAEKFATLGKVSGGIAHEIRNPLNAIKTSAYFLINAKNVSPAKVEEHLERIDRQVSMIDNVVTALSDVAKIPDANLIPLNIYSVITAAVKSISIPSEIDVEIELPSDLPKVLVDESQIIIAWKNLIRNARDAIQGSGRITVTADVLDDEVALHVTDTGTGISAADLEKILEPLFTTKARGMGLGLSITRAIVEKNKGRLQVASELGKGSRFSIILSRD